MQPTHLARVAFHDGITERYLAIATEYHLRTASYGDDGCAFELLQN